MTPHEIQHALDSMVILIDTREQDTRLLRARIKDMDCKTERSTLCFGDYSAKFLLPDGGWLSLDDKVTVERKMSLDELAQCYCQDRGRFRSEFERAKKANGKMYLLVEDGNWEKIFAGRYRTQMSSKAMLASVCAWLARYNCQILFCQPETTGKLIKQVLYREGKELMDRGDADG